MWKDETRQIVFCLCVDDFGVKYFNRNDTDHLLNTLGKNYNINFCSLKFEWNYKDGYVYVSIPGYIKDALRKLKHIPNKKPQYSPREQFPVDYAKHDTTQYATAPDKSPTLAHKEIKYIQSVVGTFLY